MKFICTSSGNVTSSHLLIRISITASKFQISASSEFSIVGIITGWRLLLEKLVFMCPLRTIIAFRVRHLDTKAKILIDTTKFDTVRPCIYESRNACGLFPRLVLVASLACLDGWTL